MYENIKAGFNARNKTTFTGIKVKFHISFLLRENGQSMLAPADGVIAEIGNNCADGNIVTQDNAELTVSA